MAQLKIGSYHVYVFFVVVYYAHPKEDVDPVHWEEQDVRRLYAEVPGWVTVKLYCFYEFSINVRYELLFFVILVR